MLKLVFYGLAGSGKSTTTGIFRTVLEQQGLRTTVLKLAQPLYEIQQLFYRVAGQPLNFYMQDQVLLEIIATQLRRISPTSLANDFVKRLALVEADIVINDDLRDPYVDYPELKRSGFRFIRVQCDETVRVARLNARNDLSVIMYSASTADIDAITPDFVIYNNGNYEDLYGTVNTVLSKLGVAL